MIGPEEGLADLKPLLPFHPASYLPEISAGMLIIGIIVIAYRYITRGSVFGSAEPPASRSRRAIAEANNSYRGGKLSLPDYCSKLSLIVRTYLQDTFGLPAANMTAAEISGSASAPVKTTTDFLFQCEARAYLPETSRSEEALAMGAEARKLIDKLEEGKDAELS
jgi:hypothetical protein